MNLIKLSSYFEYLSKYFDVGGAYPADSMSWIVKKDNKGLYNIFMRDLTYPHIDDKMDFEKALKLTQDVYNGSIHSMFVSTVSFHVPANKLLLQTLPEKYKDWTFKLLVNREWNNKTLLKKTQVAPYYGEPYVKFNGSCGRESFNFNIQTIKNLCGAVTVSGWNWDNKETGYDFIRKIVHILGFGGFFYHVASHQGQLLEFFKNTKDATELGKFTNPRTSATITTFFVNV